MANAVVRIPFSASTQGKGIKVVQTSTAGTAIHTTGTGLYTAAFDELYVYAYNGHTADVLLTLEWGGVTVPDNTIALTIPFKQGAGLVVAGLQLSGSGSAGLTVGAFAGTANVIVLYGYVLRVTN